MGTSAAATVSAADSLALTRRAWDALVADRENLGLPDLTVVPLIDFLQAAEDPARNPDLLTGQDRDLILDQAEVLIRDLYPHLPFKLRDFKDAALPFNVPVDPLGLVRKLRRRIQAHGPVLAELEFHFEMLRIFASVRDPHTAYALPKYFHGAVAFLPFRIGFYDDKASGKRKFIVTTLMEGFDHPDFQPGVELVSRRPDFSDFTPEVEQAALLSPGANAAAQLQRGVLRATVRPLATVGPIWRSLAATEQSASFVYLREGSAERHLISFPWGLIRATGLHQNFPGQAFSISQDLRTSRHASTLLWNRRQHRETAPAVVPGVVSRFPDVFEFQTTTGISGTGSIAPGNLAAAKHPGKQFGYIAIKSFSTDASADLSNDLPDEFRRILSLLQPNAPDGLVVDVRGNPGGDIVAAESMLQMLTARPVTPANFHLANTEAVLRILKVVASDESASHELSAWAAEHDGPPLPNGNPLTSGQPLTPAPNAVGQIYQGPVVLLVDALTYSAADIFSGGFSDNGVGKVIASDASTGGGGASVWPQSDLVTRLPATNLNLQTLPNGVAMSLAILRSSRVGKNLGKPIEDIGVHPDLVRPRTLNDLLSSSGNSVPSDLVGFACEVLAGMPVHRIEISNITQMPHGIQMKVTAVNIDSVEFILDQDSAPIKTITAVEAEAPVLVPFHPGGLVPGQMIVRGLSGGVQAASKRVIFEQQAMSRRRRSD